VVGAIALEPSVDPVADIADVDAGFPERSEEEIKQKTKIVPDLLQTFGKLLLTALVGLVGVTGVEEYVDQELCREAVVPTEPKRGGIDEGVQSFAVIAGEAGDLAGIRMIAQ